MSSDLGNSYHQEKKLLCSNTFIFELWSFSYFVFSFNTSKIYLLKMKEATLYNDTKPSADFKTCLGLSYSNTSFQLCSLLCCMLSKISDKLLRDFCYICCYLDVHQRVWSRPHNASPNNDLPRKGLGGKLPSALITHIIFCWPFWFDLLNLSPQPRLFHTNTTHTCKTLITGPFPETYEVYLLYQSPE